MIVFSPWIDIILFALVVYLIEYGLYKFYKINIFQVKYIIIGGLVDILFLLSVGYLLGYSKLDLVFPFGLNWFWYSVIIMFIVEGAVVKLYDFKLNNEIK